MDIFSVFRSEQLLEKQKVNHVDSIIKEQGVGVVNSVDYTNGKLPLHYAAELGSIELVYKFLSHGAHLNVYDGSGRVPLHYAALSKNTLIVDLLAYKEVNSDIEERERTNLSLNIASTETGETALHMACAKKDFAMASCLKLLGANLAARDNYGRTPYDCVPNELNDDDFTKDDFIQFSTSNQASNPFLSSRTSNAFTTPVPVFQGVTVPQSGTYYNGDNPISEFGGLNLGRQYSPTANRRKGRKGRRNIPF